MAARAAGAMDGQRRPVTVLFTDIVDSTALPERIGDEAAFLLTQRLFASWVAIIHEHKGTVQEFTGDGIMALFGAPLSLEDAPVRACRAAVAIRDATRMIADEIAEQGIRPNVRVGVHTGRVVVGKIGTDQRVEFTAIGDTANTAARLEQEAEPGTILVSAELHGQVAGIAETTFLGKRILKGKSKPQEIYRLDGLKPDAARFDARLQRGLTPLVGRSVELTKIEERWRSAKDGGIEMVFVIGEAGIGKSRLIHEVRERRRDEGPIALLQGHCLPDGSATAFLPFIEVVRRAFRITPDHDRETAKARFRDGLIGLGLQPDQHLPLLLNLLGYAVDPEARATEAESLGIRTRETLQEVLIARCRVSPVLLVLEDLHWIDSASQSLLAWVAQLRAPSRLLVLCTYRPEYNLSWATRTRTTVIELGPLQRGSVLELLHHRLSSEQLSASTIERLVDKAEGNPLFAEEIAGHLLERTRSSGGGPPDQTTVDVLPTTLETLLLQRVDQLDEMPRRVVQIASIFGRWFEPELVAQVLGASDIVNHLAELEARQLVFAETADGRRFRFKHALIQEAVYGTLLTAESRKLHLLAGEVIERAFSGRINEVADVLAYHFSQTEQTEKAIRYLAMAGEKSLRLYSIDEARERFGEALTLLKSGRGLVEEALTAEIVRAAARTNFFRADVSASIKILEEFQPEIESLGDKGLLSFHLSELGYSYVFSAEADKARRLLDRAQTLAIEAGNERALGYATLGQLWRNVFWVEPIGSQREDVQRLAHEALDIGRHHHDAWLMVTATFALALDAVMHSNPREIRRCADQLVKLYTETDDRRAKALSLVVLAELDVFNSDYDQAVERANEAAPWLLTPIDQLNTECILGMSAAMKGRGEEALRILGAIRDKTVGMNCNLTCLLIDQLMGVAHASCGRVVHGVRWINETMDRFSAWGFMTGPAHGHLFLGELYTRLALRTDKPPSWRFVVRNLASFARTMPFAASKARWHLQRSIDLHRRYASPSYVAWSLLNLGFLDLAQKRYDTARQHLTEAREIAQSVDAFALLRRIDNALERLPPMATAA